MVDAKIRILGDVAAAQRALDTLSKSNKGLENQTKANTRAAREYESAIKSGSRAAVQALDDVGTAADRAKKKLDDVKFGREQLGDLSTFTSSAASLTGGNEALGLASEVTGLLEYVPKFEEAVSGARDAIDEAGGAFNLIKTSVTSTVSNLVGVPLSFGAIVTAAAPLVAVGAAVAGAIALVTSAYEEQKRIAEAAAEASLQGLDAETKARFLAQRARFDELKQQLAVEEETAALATATYVAQYEELQRLSNATVGELVKEFGDIGLATAEIDRLKLAVQDSGKVQSEAQQRYEGVKKVVTEYNDQIQRHTQFQERQAAATSDTTKEVEKLNSELNKSNATIAQLKEQQAELNKSYREASAAVIARRQQEDARRQEDEDLAASRRQEDLDRQLERLAIEHQRNLEAIQKRGDDAILQARKDLADKEASAVKQIADLQDQFRREQAKAEQEFLKQRRRDAQDFRREQRRAQLDFERSQLENLIENDISSIIVDEMNREVEKRRDRQDFRRERRRGRRDFDEERREAEQALQERIAAIQKELEEYRAATEAKIAQIQLQTETELALAQAAYEERLALDAEERRTQNERDAEDSRIANERRQQDRAAEDMARLISHQTAMAQIAEKAALETSIANGLIMKLQQANALLQQSTLGGGGIYTGTSGSQITSPTTPSKTKPTAPSNVIPISPQFTGAQNTRGRGGGKIEINLPAPQVVDIGGMQFITYEQFDAAVGAIAAGIDQAQQQRRTV